MYGNKNVDVVTPRNEGTIAKGALSPDINKDTFEAVSDTQIRAHPESMHGPQQMDNTPAADSGTGIFKQLLRPGPVDPLTGQASGEADFTPLLRGIERTNMLLEYMLHGIGSIITELRAANPQSLCRLGNQDGVLTLGTTPSRWNFFLEGKPVTAFRIFVQNNSTSDLTLGIGKPGVQGSVVVKANGGSYNSTEKVEFISLTQVTAVANVSVNGQTAANVVVIAWTNPENTYRWGQA